MLGDGRVCDKHPWSVAEGCMDCKRVSVWDIVNVDEIRGWECDRIELKDGNLTIYGFRRTVDRRPPSKPVNARG